MDSIPDISGIWRTTTGTSVLFTGEIQELGPAADTWNITQQDWIITGTNSFKIEDELIEEISAGIIEPDGKTVHIVDKNGGLYIATLDSENSMFVRYLNTGDVRDKPGYGPCVNHEP